MGSHNSFGHLKHKLWPKEGAEVKLLIWLSIIKSQESPWFPCFQVLCHILLKSFRWGLQIFFKPHLNRRCAHKVMDPQSCGSPICGSPGTKWHLGASPMSQHRIYYKGEGGGFPQVRAMVSFMSPCLPMAGLCTKVLQLRITQLVI